MKPSYDLLQRKVRREVYQQTNTLAAFFMKAGQVTGLSNYYIYRIIQGKLKR